MPRDMPAIADTKWDAKPAPHFNLVPFDRIGISNNAQYLIKGLVPRDGLVVAWGPPKCGKSFWAFDLAMHIALGRSYRGLRVKMAPVIYVAAEGAAGLGARVEAWRRDHGLGDVRAPFWLLPDRLDLSAQAPVLVNDIAAQVGALKPGLVVLDTLNRTFTGSENDDEAMGAYIRAADSIKAAFPCTVLIIHHCGISANRPRGHTSLTGAADCQIAVKKSEDGVIEATVEYLKDGPEGYSTKSRLRVVEVGTDEDGDPITSCVVEETTDEMAASIKLSAKQRDAITQLQNAIIDAGERKQHRDFPAHKPVVPLALWKGRCESAGVLSVDNEETAKKQWQRLRTDLKEKGLIGTWDNFVWLVGHGGQEGDKTNVPRGTEGGRTGTFS